MTYEIGLTNTGGSLDIDVTAIDLYLSDDKDLTTASSAFPSDEDDFPLKIASDSDGSTLSTGLSASVTADSEQCDKYVFLCAKVTPNAAVECIDVKDEIDCQDSGVASLSAKHCILVTTLVAMVKIMT
ncbi:uncharacterized protein [Ptychodera flava]|uniref:uncharacterized protein n=1 Tax=Ptychodera flava TaxID=63121 RepID=UPI00396AA4CB